MELDHLTTSVDGSKLPKPVSSLGHTNDASMPLRPRSGVAPAFTLESGGSHGPRPLENS